jgi:23S rRNA pseudouridine1911/1915/1917 synthase
MESDSKKAPVKIIYEDEDLFIIDKPAHLAVLPLRNSSAENLSKWLVGKDPLLSAVGKTGEAGIVHRLDNTTSGITVVARNSVSYIFLRDIWNTTQVKKNYTALVLGNAAVQANLDGPIAHHPSKKKKMMVCDTPQKMKDYSGREAHTACKKIRNYLLNGNVYSLLEVQITTGVRHQIRVHLASAGHPLVGDILYQNALKKSQDELNLTRPFLHLSRISFPHPKDGNRVEFESALAPDLAKALKLLK